MPESICWYCQEVFVNKNEREVEQWELKHSSVNKGTGHLHKTFSRFGDREDGVGGGEFIVRIVYAHGRFNSSSAASVNREQEFKGMNSVRRKLGLD